MIWNAGKMSSHFIGLMVQFGPMAYRLALRSELVGVHDIFHVSLLRKYVHKPNHIINYPLLDLWKDLSYDEYPWEIVDRQERKFHSLCEGVMDQPW